MELVDRVFWCLFLTGFFSKPKLERVCSMQFEDIKVNLPMVEEFKDFNLFSNREGSLALLEKACEYVSEEYAILFRKFINSSFFTPIEFLSELITRLGPRLDSKLDLALDLEKVWGD